MSGSVRPLSVCGQQGAAESVQQQEQDGAKERQQTGRRAAVTDSRKKKRGIEQRRKVSVSGFKGNRSPLIYWSLSCSLGLSLQHRSLSTSLSLPLLCFISGRSESERRSKRRHLICKPHLRGRRRDGPGRGIASSAAPATGSGSSPAPGSVQVQLVHTASSLPRVLRWQSLTPSKQ